MRNALHLLGSHWGALVPTKLVEACGLRPLHTCFLLKLKGCKGSMERALCTTHSPISPSNTLRESWCRVPGLGSRWVLVKRGRFRFHYETLDVSKTERSNLESCCPCLVLV